MIVYRISKCVYASDLTGEGARLAGGRWNSRGIPAIYTSESRALCALEVAVHLPLKLAPKDYCLSVMEIPASLIFQPDNELLPDRWNHIPHTDASQKYGDAFLQSNQYMALRVPSAIVPEEYNVIINPRHPEISTIKIHDVLSFPFDERLFK